MKTEQETNVAMDIQECIDNIVPAKDIRGDDYDFEGDNAFRWRFEYNGMEMTVVFVAKPITN